MGSQLKSLLFLSSLCATTGLRGIETRSRRTSLPLNIAVLRNEGRPKSSPFPFPFSSCSSSLCLFPGHHESLFIAVGDYASEIEQATGVFGVPLLAFSLAYLNAMRYVFM